MTFDYLRYQDESTQATFFTLAANNWMALRIDMVSALMVLLVAVAAALSSKDPGKHRNGRDTMATWVKFRHQQLVGKKNPQIKR